MYTVNVRPSQVFLPELVSVFHKTSDLWRTKFVWNSQSSLWTWQFHYVVVNQIANFETQLLILH